VISGSVMLKDETRCIRCGLCAARCPVGTITMESYNLIPAEHPTARPPSDTGRGNDPCDKRR